MGRYSVLPVVENIIRRNEIEYNEMNKMNYNNDIWRLLIQVPTSHNA